MKASTLIRLLQKMVNNYGDLEVESYDDSILPIKVKRITLSNASDWEVAPLEKCFRVRCR